MRIRRTQAAVSSRLLNNKPGNGELAWVVGMTYFVL
jgi:hypothetical protein